MSEIVGAWIVVAVLGVAVVAFPLAPDQATSVLTSAPLSVVDVPRSNAWQSSTNLPGTASDERYGSRLHAEEDTPVWARGLMAKPTNVSRADEPCPVINLCAIDTVAITIEQLDALTC